VGLGTEFRLGPNLMLDAGVRYVWAHDPPTDVHFNADWKQVTVGLLYKLPR
jgi:opacity protein-like surface antigen